ncbi:PAS domain-containing protein [Myxococcus sp. K38C18041901]|uniref:PAS domain-containing sensor histidine kinase n=1 Tax=Myxococcus guangdongensis TaxID=2906760 RepID=UPI0020A7902F|nr:PAS domain-containing protein [Myxococcus guangdongensis]MCP3059280.1 PAS domain-containing protein [Myxococcus guangdongensis]
MTKGDMRRGQAGPDAQAASRPVAPHERLLEVGRGLRAALVVDAQGRVVWMDRVLALAAGWEDGAEQGRSSREALARLPWLFTAVRAALSGEQGLGEGSGQGQRLCAVVLPVYGDDGSLVGACARLQPKQTARAEPPAPSAEHVREHYERLIDSIDGIVWEADAEFRFTFVSRQAERLLGLHARRWLSEPDFWSRHVHPEDWSRVMATCLDALRRGHTHELEFRMMTDSGASVWMRTQVTASAVDGQPVRLRGLMVDVTEQRRAREHGEHTHSVLRATFDSIADGVIVVDADQRIIAYNKRFQDMWGLSDAMMDSRIAEAALRHAAPLTVDPATFIAHVQAQFIPSAAVSVNVIEMKDGRVLESTSLPQRMGDAIIGRVWSYRDVTQERRAKVERERLLVAEQNARERTEESFALLDTFLNHAPVGLAFVGRDLRYLRINTALASLHGHSREWELGRTVWEANPLMAPHFAPLMLQVMETGLPMSDMEMSGRVPATPEELRHWRVSYYPVSTPSAGIVGLGAVVVEVTQEHRSRQERERLLKEAQEAIRVRDDFLSIAAHELKTPLTPLKLHLQMMKQQATQGHAPKAHHVDKALSQVSRLSLLIHDLLDATRIEAGRLELRRGPVELQGLTDEVLAEARPLTGQHTLELVAPPEPLVVLGDRGRLAQVLSNLLENAFKYSPTGGSVRLKLERDGSMAHVSVRDSGIGIPEDQREHLFQRFFRARNAPISGFGGLGLGLYICRDIVERHGGHIWVDTRVGHGSTFHFTLPLAP